MKYKMTYRLIGYFSAVLLLFAVAVGGMLMFLSSKQMTEAYEEELKALSLIHIFARTFASKVRTMSFTFGTLSMLILLSLLCLNFSSINKGVYRTSIELNAPYDVEVFDWTQPFDDFNEYVRVIDEDYTINKIMMYNVYKEPGHQIQNYYDVQFYDYDPVMKLSDYNQCLALRNMRCV